MDEKAVERQIQRDKAKSSRRVRNEVASRFQLRRRLESALVTTPVSYVDKGVLRTKARPVGLCVCVTCGQCDHYKKMDGGHFQSRDHPFTMLMTENVNVQCKYCNDKRTLAGNYGMYRQWIDQTIDKDSLIAQLVKATDNLGEAELHADSTASEVMIRLSSLPSPHTPETLAVARININQKVRELTAQIERVSQDGVRHGENRNT